ncbi:conserved hypothetical protein [Lebetimonas natsushimae]|uniref:Uncharacterized protein n=1 Tax=Lebetimonas natsushimae TaxID=1936991 RepID=A0A292YBW8_9BACT|nr:shikimate kinase [Lebetimonas natsushimae]GAX86991.1 conserved hypothetical protein [Lebetimonas natsushimae]
MKISNYNISQILQIDAQKKAQDVVKNVIGNLLEKTFENTKAVEEAAKTTGRGNNFNLKV